MNDKVIWITGASTGIGKALAIKFSQNGWKVAISARREVLLNEIASENKNIFAFPFDVTDKDKCNSTFNLIKNKFDNIDLCVFSTGTWDPKKEKEIDVAAGNARSPAADRPRRGSQHTRPPQTGSVDIPQRLTRFLPANR